MTTSTDIREHTIDATDKRLGRVASEAAHVLLGKDTPAFAKHVVAPVRVHIEGAGKLAITEARKDGKVYTRYSGHPGGLKAETLQDVIEKRGVGEALRRAVYNMLPANRLRKERMKHLVITE